MTKLIALIDAEIWKDVPEYTGLYQVSNLGNVRSVERVEVCGDKLRRRAGKLLSQTFNPKTGYQAVNLYKNSKAKHSLVHRLVFMAFHNETPEEVNHIDGDKRNNFLANLEKSTRLENSLHSTRVLKKNIGADNKASKLCEEDVKIISELLKTPASNKEIAENFGVTAGAISRIRRGHNWSHLTGIVRS